MAKIDVEGLSFDYLEKNGSSYCALKNINFSIEEGEFVSILGSSGCGKSTILSLLAGLNKPTSGAIKIDGVETYEPSKNRAVVFQHYSLFPWMTVRKNIIFGIKQNFPQYTKTSLKHIADSYIEHVGLRGFENKYPYQLSGGMQQRTAIARALAMKTDILLMDEPFGAVDAKNRVILQDFFLQLLEEEEKKTVVFITHDVQEAVLLSDRILFIKDKTIVHDIKIELERPRNREELLDSAKFITIRKKISNLFYYNEMKKENFEGGEGI